MPSLIDYRNILEAIIKELYHPPHLLVITDYKQHIFFVYLNDKQEEPIEFPFKETEEKITCRSAKIFVNYIKDKLGDK